MLEWLIIGGGVHGTYLSNALKNRLGVDKDRIRVLDPSPMPLAGWERCAENVGMKYLRSPAVHHIGLEPMELLHFARNKSEWLGSFRPPYDRPSVQLFSAFSAHVCEKGGLLELREEASASEICECDGGYQVETDQGAISTRRIIIATGMGEGLRVGDWVSDIGEEAPVWHVLDPQFRRSHLEAHETIGIVGMGISAGQLACAMAAEGKEIELYGEQGIEVETFDSSPCWLGPKCQVGFRRLESPRLRRQAIEKARNRGTMPRDVARELRNQMKWGQVNHIQGWVSGATTSEEGVVVQLERGETRQVDALVLATGHGRVAVQESWMGSTINRLGLACSECGAPMVDEYLRWAPNLFVSGALAELELGPAARNIAGSRMAGRKILKAVA